MLSDPQSITISGTPISLPKTGTGGNVGTFTSADTTVSEVFSHAYGKRVRRSARLNISKVSADVLIPSQNARSSASMTVVFDVPVNGYTVAEVKAAWDGFAAQLAASSGAMVTQILGGQN
jgi:hypothetical protein